MPRVLWITHDPLRLSGSHGASTSGYWKEALHELISNHGRYTIAVASPRADADTYRQDENRFRVPTGRKRSPKLHLATRDDLLRIIRRVSPDLLHIHGTETPYGLIATETDIPAVVSLQGFVSVCAPYTLGGLTSAEWRRHITLRNILQRTSPHQIHQQWLRRGETEIQILRSLKNYIGRTLFDESILRKHNRGAAYYQGGELLRPCFYQDNWSIETACPHTIYAPACNNPLKGFHVLLEAVAILRSSYPDIRVRVPGELIPRHTAPIIGNAYSRLIKHLITRHKLEKHVCFLGRLTGEQVKANMLASHVFCLPSFIENSSNTLGEAMQLGVPSIIALNAGGTMDMVSLGESTQTFEKGNAMDLASAISNIFDNAKLARGMSFASRPIATERYSPTNIYAQYSHIYDTLLS